jgi:hypothetical protein
MNLVLVILFIKRFQLLNIDNEQNVTNLIESNHIHHLMKYVVLYMIFMIVMMKIHTFPLFAIRPMFIAMKYFN